MPIERPKRRRLRVMAEAIVASLRVEALPNLSPLDSAQARRAAALAADSTTCSETRS